MQIGVESAKAVDQRRVFVVDTDEVTRTALQFMLHDEIETHEMASLDEAYGKGTDWLKPDLLLLGAAFLKQEGTGLIAALHDRFPGSRILVTCDKEDEPLAAEAVKAGANGLLVKPLTIEGVRRKVDTVLGRSGGQNLVQIAGLS